MEFTEKELLAKKKEIENAKNEIAENKGELKGLMKQLKETWECSSLDEAKKKLKKMEIEINEFKNQIEIATEELTKTYFNKEGEI